MAVQLRLLDGDDEHRQQSVSSIESLPESSRRDVCERFAELLVAVVRSASRKERSNDLDEDRAQASGA